ncbi:MAG: hypothetical protein WA003_15940 [Desulfuromonadaceae bacterium]
MFKRILAIICVTTLASTLSGCIGLHVFAPMECKNESPTTTINWSSQSNSLPQAGSNKTDFLKYRGKPDEIISVSDNEEIWVYKKTLWCGIMPIFILPVPLVLPLCDGFDRIEFRGNEGVRLHTRRIVDRGFVIGPDTGGVWNESNTPVCIHPLPPNNGLDPDTANPAVQVKP